MFSFCGLGFTLCLDIMSPKKVLMCIWNGIHLCFVSGLSVCIFVIHFVECHHGLCHCCHSLQPEYHLQCQIHLVNLYIFHLFIIETYLLQGLLPNGNFLYLYLPNWHGYKCCEVWWPLIYLNAVIPVTCIYKRDILHLILGKYHWVLVTYWLVIQVLGSALPDPGIVWLFHWIWVPVQSCSPFFC